MEYNKNLLESLRAFYKYYQEIEKKSMQLDLPQQELKKINKEIKNNKVLIETFLEYQQMIKTAEQNEIALSSKSALGDELAILVKDELDDIKTRMPSIEEKLKILLLPKDPNDDKNIIVEMRPAAGGNESCIFVSDLFTAYKKYFDTIGWEVKILDVSSNAHGYDYLFFSVTGENVYSKMKFESGVHRVQRVPATEAKGRVHTSTITVAVLPELDEISFKINPTDLRIDKYRSGGAGGQHVNRTDSAVRITHIPTGIVVACSQERSQIENKANAMKMLNARIWEKLENDRTKSIADNRKQQVGMGDRSEKIRTYNYPQNRFTDHRINLTLNKLDRIMLGEFDEVFQALIANEQTEKIKQFSQK